MGHNIITIFLLDELTRLCKNDVQKLIGFIFSIVTFCQLVWFLLGFPGTEDSTSPRFQ
jgi:hypothetical protein